MDERDFSILSRLRKDPFSSYETLGRGIGLSGNAVKARIKALEKIGILTSLKAMPAAQVFHRFPRLFFFKLPISSSEKVDTAMEIATVVFATADVNNKVGILVYDGSSLPKPLEELITLLGTIESEVTPLFPYQRKELSEPVSLVELRVLRMLVDDIRVSLKMISLSTGLSQKIVRETRKQLMEKGLFQVQPIFQSAQSSRILMYEVHVHSNDNSVLERVRQTLPNSVFLNQWEEKVVVLSCWSNSISEVFETEKRLKSEPGVTNVQVKFHARAILSSARLIDWIDEEIARLDKRKKVA